MKRYAILILVFHILLEAAEIIERLFPFTTGVYIDPFINYKWPHDPRGISVLWWINYVCNDLLWIVTYFVLAKVGKAYSYALFRVAFTFFIYHIVGHFMMWYNYRTGHYVYWCLGAASIWCIYSIFRKEKATGKVISLK